MDKPPLGAIQQHAPTVIIFFVALDINPKLGQLFFVGFQGYTLSQETKHFLKTIQPGGIIFFEENIRDIKQVKDLIKEINSLIRIKPFIGVDQEGGSVERLRKICTSVPSLWGLSKVGLKELLGVEQIISAELSELGFNMNFAPVLDINSNVKNPVIGTRAISDNTRIVSDYGAAIIKLFIKNGIIPVVKHFPGHGDLSIDSHLDLPVLSKTFNELNQFELIPFKKAINIKVPVIMVSHIHLPELDSKNTIPASLSKNILQKLLRNKLDYKGLIITDELNMKGVTKHYSLNNASHKAITSGAELLLFNSNESQTLSVFNYINKKALTDKKLLQEINNSYKKIISTKERFLNYKRKNIKCSFAGHRKISHNLGKQTVHWIKKDLFFNPITTNKQIEIIYPDTPKLRKEDLILTCKNLSIKHPALISYSLNPNQKDIAKIRKKVRKNTNKILITYDIACRPGQKTLVKELFERNKNLTVVSAGLEYDIEYIPYIRNFIASYSPNYISLFCAFEKLLS